MPTTRHPVSMISALSLGPMPQLVERELGGNALRRIFHASGLTTDLLVERTGYIPQPALVRFFAETARSAGERWILAPWISEIQIRDYGTWGDWVLSAETLEAALLRGMHAIHLHGTNDVLTLRKRKDQAIYSYSFAEASTPGYDELAIGGAAALVNYCREYLGREWVPDRLELNISDLSHRDLETLACHFGCPVTKSENAIRLIFDAKLLNTNRRKAGTCCLTFEDIIRERMEGRPVTLADQVRSQVRRNLSDRLVRIDDTARSLDLATRTLQQRLHVEGESYRELVQSVRIGRAKELLRDNALSVTEVAFELGYEHVGHFTRMFATNVGMPPSVYATQNIDPVPQQTGL
ncbi:MAG: AraC family transcriptional regulator ligand-binding domain-containing protein [Pseudomonadota bacterium]